VRSGSAAARRASRAIAQLVRVMDILRSPEGCPWDRKQTHASLRQHLVEETYEVLAAIDRGDLDALRGELGDVLFQCVFHAQIARERGRFDLADAIEAITAKLIRRHPHVFTPSGRPLSRARRRASGIRTPAAVKEQWEKIKAGEQRAAGQERRVLAGVPAAMPALLRAHEIGRRVAAVGFDWPKAADVVDKIDEEVRELREALHESPARAAEELGDLLFSLANLARKLGAEPESALRAANDKFTRRFAALEARLEREGRSVHDVSLDDLERAWTAVKAAAPAPPPNRRRSSSARARDGRPSRP
jgi:nucleoside triphosphate diphosphatase